MLPIVAVGLILVNMNLLKVFWKVMNILVTVEKRKKW